MPRVYRVRGLFAPAIVVLMGLCAGLSMLHSGPMLWAEGEGEAQEYGPEQTSGAESDATGVDGGLSTYFFEVVDNSSEFAAEGEATSEDLPLEADEFLAEQHVMPWARGLAKSWAHARAEAISDAQAAAQIEAQLPPPTLGELVAAAEADAAGNPIGVTSASVLRGSAGNGTQSSGARRAITFLNGPVLPSAGLSREDRTQRTGDDGPVGVFSATEADPTLEKVLPIRLYDAQASDPACADVLATGYFTFHISSSYDCVGIDIELEHVVPSPGFCFFADSNGNLIFEILPFSCTSSPCTYHIDEEDIEDYADAVSLRFNHIYASGMPNPAAVGWVWGLLSNGNTYCTAQLADPEVTGGYTYSAVFVLNPATMDAHIVSPYLATGTDLHLHGAGDSVTVDLGDPTEHVHHPLMPSEVAALWGPGGFEYMDLHYTESGRTDPRLVGVPECEDPFGTIFVASLALVQAVEDSELAEEISGHILFLAHPTATHTSVHLDLSETPEATEVLLLDANHEVLYRWPVYGARFDHILTECEDPSEVVYVSVATAEYQEGEFEDGAWVGEPVWEGNEEQPAAYAPGCEVVWQLELDYSGTAPVTALGLKVQLPYGWSYSRASSQYNSVVPAEAKNTSGGSEFVWIEKPEFPFNTRLIFQTNGTPGTGQLGARNLTYQLLYRTTGDEIVTETRSKPFITLPLEPEGANGCPEESGDPAVGGMSEADLFQMGDVFIPKGGPPVLCSLNNDPDAEGGAFHSADTNDGQTPSTPGWLTLSELLRIIQFYNSSRYHCESDTEDGFAPGFGDETCTFPHDSDYNPQDWQISLSELLRAIQFYNSGGYRCCAGQFTEDGFCPGSCPNDPPILELNGDAYVEQACYISDPGVFVTNCNGVALSAAGVFVTSDPSGAFTNQLVNVEYEVTYSFTGPEGIAAESKIRHLKRLPDLEPPVIALMGSVTETVECSASYTEAGATGIDNCDGVVTANIVVGGDTVDTTTPGTYVVAYDAIDASSNAATTVTRTVDVVDTTAPSITLNGNASVTVQCGSPYTEAGATATDTCDTAVTVVTDGDTVDTNTPGTYVVAYNATDASNNPATTVTRTVDVVDETAPTIALLGADNVPVECGDTYTDAGATASDACDGSLTGNIVVGGDTVDTTTPGSYTVTYNVSDAAGNAAAEVSRTVNVADTTPPTIDLGTDDPYMLECFGEFDESSDPILVSDACEGPINGFVTVGTVDPTTVGNYEISYIVEDSAHNQAVENTSRTVTVPGPEFELLSDVNDYGDGSSDHPYVFYYPGYPDWLQVTLPEVDCGATTPKYTLAWEGVPKDFENGKTFLCNATGSADTMDLRVTATMINPDPAGTVKTVKSSFSFAGKYIQIYRPNILFLNIDDLNDWVSFLDTYPAKDELGNDYNKLTPNLLSLARKSTSFTSAYCASPVCTPSRASLFIGRHPMNTGMYATGDWFRASVRTGTTSDSSTTSPYPFVTKSILPRFLRDGAGEYKVWGYGKNLHTAPVLEYWTEWAFGDPMDTYDVKYGINESSSVAVDHYYQRREDPLLLDNSQLLPLRTSGLSGDWGISRLAVSPSTLVLTAPASQATSEVSFTVRNLSPGLFGTNHQYSYRVKYNSAGTWIDVPNTDTTTNDFWVTGPNGAPVGTLGPATEANIVVHVRRPVDFDLRVEGNEAEPAWTFSPIYVRCTTVEAAFTGGMNPEPDEDPDEDPDSNHDHRDFVLVNHSPDIDKTVDIRVTKRDNDLVIKDGTTTLTRHNDTVYTVTLPKAGVEKRLTVYWNANRWIDFGASIPAYSPGVRDGLAEASPGTSDESDGRMDFTLTVTKEGDGATVLASPTCYFKYDDANGAPDALEFADTLLAQSVRDRLLALSNADGSPTSRPFFLAAGIYRPHNALYLPEDYYDAIKGTNGAESQFPGGIPGPEFVESWQPETEVGDEAPCWGRTLSLDDSQFRVFNDSGQIVPYATAYKAGVLFADTQVGTILSALSDTAAPEKADYLRRSTAIVLWSDHGFHLGEKEHLWKQAMWERTTRIPMLVHLPGQTEENSTEIDTPVSLLDLYPTVLDLAGVHYPWHLYAQRGTLLSPPSEADTLQPEKTRAVSLLPVHRDPIGWERKEYEDLTNEHMEEWFTSANNLEAKWVLERANENRIYSLGTISSSLPVVTSFVRAEVSPSGGCEGENSGSNDDAVIHAVRSGDYRYIRYQPGIADNAVTPPVNELYDYSLGHDFSTEATNLLPKTLPSELTSALPLGDPPVPIALDGFGYRQYFRLDQSRPGASVMVTLTCLDSTVELKYEGSGSPNNVSGVFWCSARLEYVKFNPQPGISLGFLMPNLVVDGSSVRSYNFTIEKVSGGSIALHDVLGEIVFKCVQEAGDLDVGYITRFDQTLDATAKTTTLADKSITSPEFVRPTKPYLEEEVDLAD